MKKFFAIAMVLGFCLAITMPASAAVSVSGDVGYTIKYETRGEDNVLSVSANNNDHKNFEIHPAVQKAQIRFSWEAGPATPYIDLAMRKYDYKWGQQPGNDVLDDEVEIRFGVNYKAPSGAWGGQWEVVREWFDDRDNTVSVAASNEDTEYIANIWWQVNDMLKLSFADNWTVTGHGKSAEKVGAYGSTDNDNLFRAEMGFSAGKLTVDFIDPESKGTVIAGGGTWRSTQYMNTMPGVSLTFDAKIGPVSIAPNYRSQSFNWERGVGGFGPAAGSDDGYTAWGAKIPVMAKIGPVGLSVAYAWGENIGDAFTKDTQKGAVKTYSPAAGVIRFDDTEYTGWNIDATINAGIGTLMAGYGYDKTDARATATTRTEIERDAFYIKYAIPVGKGFTITPKFAKYNDGETTTGGIVNPATDDNTRKLYSVNFNVRF